MYWPFVPFSSLHSFASKANENSRTTGGVAIMLVWIERAYWPLMPSSSRKSRALIRSPFASSTAWSACPTGRIVQTWDQTTGGSPVSWRSG